MLADEFKHLSAMIIGGRQQSGRILRTVLKALGMRHILVVAETDAALYALRHDIYDVVFCDDDCAGANPVAFFKAMRRDPASRNPAVPIILVSGGVRRRQVELMRDCGANCVLVRPVSAEAVARKLRSIVFTPRRFVSTNNFVGPDRRNEAGKPYEGCEKRQKDLARVAAAVIPNTSPAKDSAARPG